MKKVIFALFLFFLSTPMMSQTYDLIVVDNVDSIACHIDSITDETIYFEMYVNYQWMQTQLSKSQVTSYKMDAFKKNEVKLKPGSSYIASVKSPGTEKEISDIQRNAIVFAHDFFFSIGINYERVFPVAGKAALGARAGFGYNYGDINSAIMLGGIFLYGHHKHYFETGVHYEHNFSDELGPILAIIAGYRFQSPKGFLFKIYPEFLFDLVPMEGSFGNFPWLGFALGYSF